MVVDLLHFITEAVSHIVALTEHRGAHQFFATSKAVAWLLPELITVHLLQGHLMVRSCVPLTLLAKVPRGLPIAHLELVFILLASIRTKVIRLASASSKPLVLWLMCPWLEIVLYTGASVLVVHLKVCEAHLILVSGILFLILCREATAHWALTAIYCIVFVRLKN